MRFGTSSEVGSFGTTTQYSRRTYTSCIFGARAITIEKENYHGAHVQTMLLPRWLYQIT